MPLTAERTALTYARHHRLRRTHALRRLVAETRLTPSAFVLPVFVDARIDAPSPITSLPGHARWPVARVAEIGERAARTGIGGLLLFGLPQEKDDRGENAADPLGPVPAAQTDSFHPLRLVAAHRASARGDLGPTPQRPASRRLGGAVGRIRVG